MLQNDNDYVFHGTSEKNRKWIDPSFIHARPDTDNPLVFATRYKAIASCFLLPEDPEWIRVFFDQNGTIHMVIGSTDALAKANRGGSIYTLSAHDFWCDDRIGMRYMEWMADAPQKVLHEESFSCAVKAMQMHGVRLGSVSPHIFAALSAQFPDQIFVILTDQEMQAMRAFLDTHAKKLAA